jgi:hypothetical protein
MFFIVSKAKQSKVSRDWIWVNKVGYYTRLTALSSDANDYSCSTLKTKYPKCKFFSLVKEVLFIYIKNKFIVRK